MAEVLIGDGNNSGVDDVGMLAERQFHLFGEDVFPAGDDHPVTAALDEQPSRGIETPGVAGVQHPVQRLFARAVGVLADLAARPHEDLSGLPRRYPSTVSDDGHLDTQRWAPGGGGFGREVGRGRNGDVRSLGRAVEIVQYRPEPLGNGKHQRCVEFGAAGGDHPEPAVVDATELFLVEVHEPAQHGGDHHHCGATVFDQETQRLRCPEPPVHHHGRAGQQAHHRGKQAPAVEGRRRHQHGVGAADRDLGDEPGRQRHRHRAVARRTLRRSGAAAREDHQRRLVLRRPRQFGRTRGDQIVECAGCWLTRSLVGPGNVPADPVVNQFEDAGELRVVQDHVDLLASGHLRHLLGAEIGVQQHHTCPESDAREQTDHRKAAVAAHHSHGGPVLTWQDLTQAVHDRVAHRGQSAVRHRSVRVDQRNPAAVDGRINRRARCFTCRTPEPGDLRQLPNTRHRAGAPQFPYRRQLGTHMVQLRHATPHHTIVAR